MSRKRNSSLRSQLWSGFLVLVWTVPVLRMRLRCAKLRLRATQTALQLKTQEADLLRSQLENNRDFVESLTWRHRREGLEDKTIAQSILRAGENDSR